MILKNLVAWFDSAAVKPESSHGHHIEFLRILPFIGLHIACFAVIWVGFSRIAIAVAITMYLLRMFAITAFYHRYFAHKAFKTSRTAQGLFAFLGATAAQRGPLWWASHHRHHHVHSDDPQDVHSPKQHGFWWSHLGWFLANENFSTRMERVPELAQYPELRLIDRFDAIAPILLGFVMYGLGEYLASFYPNLQTNGLQMLVWGFVLSTVAVYHMTFTVNSLAHVWGKRRFATKDDSRNNLWIALITLGEGWHNNHHHFPGAARQGFYWWELDLTYYGLKVLSMLGLVWDLRPVPSSMLNARRIQA